MALQPGKTEHAGAKNGGGMWAPRAWAKWSSRKHRRQADQTEIARSLDLPPSPHEVPVSRRVPRLNPHKTRFPL